jgi:hypothetical protein
MSEHVRASSKLNAPSSLQLLRPEAEPDVVGGARREPSRRRVEAVGRHEVEAPEAPLQPERLHEEVGEAPPRPELGPLVDLLHRRGDVRVGTGEADVGAVPGAEQAEVRHPHDGRGERDLVQLDVERQRARRTQAGWDDQVVHRVSVAVPEGVGLIEVVVLGEGEPLLGRDEEVARVRDACGVVPDDGRRRVRYEENHHDHAETCDLQAPAGVSLAASASLLHASLRGPMPVPGALPHDATDEKLGSRHGVYQIGDVQARS